MQYIPSVGLSCFCVCIFACLTKLFVTGLVSVYFMGVKGSLFTFVQSSDEFCMMPSF